MVHSPFLIAPFSINFFAFKMAASRPLVTVQGLDGTASGQTALPAVFTAPIRPDVVLQVCLEETSTAFFLRRLDFFPALALSAFF